MCSPGGNGPLRPLGFPIRTSMDITPACGSPWLFAAYHVLLRLLMPRHSPYALFSLISRHLDFSISVVFFPKTLLFPFLKLFFPFSLKKSFFLLCSFQCTLLKKSYLPFRFFLLVICLPYLVGSSGLEPPTSRLSGVRSNRLSYEPWSL